MGSTVKVYSLIAALLLLFSFNASAQLMPTSTIWGNSKIPLRTSGDDTLGYAKLADLKSYFSAGLAGGTVTSVGVSVPTGLAVSGSPITTSGTIGITNNMAAGYVKSAGVGGALTSSSTIPTSDLSGTISNAQLANSSLTLVAGSSGSDVAFTAGSVSLGGGIQLNIPDAGTSARGVVTTQAQSFVGTKTFTAGAIVSNSGGNALTVSGGYVDGTQTASTATTLTATSNVVFADATSGAVTVTLPTTPTTGREIKIIRTSTNANNVTITRGGTDTIQGNTSIVVASPSTVTLRFSGSIWYYEFN